MRKRFIDDPSDDYLHIYFGMFQSMELILNYILIKQKVQRHQFVTYD